MMISPKMYYDKVKNYNQEQIKIEEERLKKYLEDFNDNNLSEEEMYMKPSPDVIVKMNKEYLKVLEELKNNKI